MEKLTCTVQQHTCTILTNIDIYLYSTVVHLYYSYRDNILCANIETNLDSTVVHLYYSYRDNISL